MKRMGWVIYRFSIKCWNAGMLFTAVRRTRYKMTKNTFATVRDNIWKVWTWICDTMKMYSSNGHKLQRWVNSYRAGHTLSSLKLVFSSCKIQQTWKETTNILEEYLYHKNHWSMEANSWPWKQCIWQTIVSTQRPIS